MTAKAERGINWPKQLAGFRNANIRSSLVYEGLVLVSDLKSEPFLFLLAAVPGGAGIIVELIARKIREKRVSKPLVEQMSAAPAEI